MTTKRRKRRFGPVLPVRMQTDVDSRLQIIADTAGITKSDALRMAVNHGLPMLEAGRIPVLGGAR